MTENDAVTAAVEAAKSSPIVKAADAIGQVVVPCECIGCGDEVPVDGYCLACAERHAGGCRCEDCADDRAYACGYGMEGK